MRSLTVYYLIHMKKTVLVSLFLLFPTYFSCSSLAQAEQPATTISATKDIQNTLDQIVEVVEALPGKEREKERREKLRAVINARFDFAEMSRRSLGTQWAACTPEQQQEFVALFSNLLAKTYLARIETIERNTVKVEREDGDFPLAVVKTSVHHKGDTFPIDYKLYSKESVWRIYDVIIENIGLVSNYRSEFAGVIRKEKFEGLLRQLREKAG